MLKYLQIKRVETACSAAWLIWGFWLNAGRAVTCNLSQLYTYTERHDIQHASVKSSCIFQCQVGLACVLPANEMSLLAHWAHHAKQGKSH